MTIMFRAGRPATTAALPVLGAEDTLIADVSEWQPNLSDGVYLKWSLGIVIRALFGAQHDDAAWYGGGRRAALHAGGVRFLGIYQYLVAGQDGAAQARAFHALVGPIQHGEIFVADFEQGDHAMLTAWYNEMIALYGPGIAPYLWTYTGLDFGAANGALPVQWIADYGSTEPASPHDLWQFSQTYSIPGVGVGDCSVYHGTIDQLAAKTYGAGGPKPWTFPEPAGLHLLKQTRTGYSFAWDAVTGPAGQKPTGYNVYTYNAAGAVVNHRIVPGVRTSEYGPQGEGLPAGTYRTNVWADGAPLGPPHATLTVTLTR